MFYVVKVAANEVKNIADHALVTKYNPYLVTYRDNPELTTFDMLDLSKYDIYAAVDGSNSSIVGLIAGRHDFLDTGDEDAGYIEGYRIDIFSIDETLTTTYDAASVKNMASHLLRSFCANKTAYYIFMQFSKRITDTEITPETKYALTVNEFSPVVRTTDNHTYYLRNPRQARMQAFYN